MYFEGAGSSLCEYIQLHTTQATVITNNMCYNFGVKHIHAVIAFTQFLHHLFH